MNKERRDIKLKFQDIVGILFPAIILVLIVSTFMFFETRGLEQYSNQNTCFLILSILLTTSLLSTLFMDSFNKRTYLKLKAKHQGKTLIHSHYICGWQRRSSRYPYNIVHESKGQWIHEEVDLNKYDPHFDYSEAELKDPAENYDNWD